MKKAIGLFVFVWGVAAQAATPVKSIDFKDEAQESVIEITSDGPLTYEKRDDAEKKQVIIDLKDVSLEANASRPLDTSSFASSSVTLVNPLRVEGQADQASVVVQLKDSANAEVTQDGNVLRIKVPHAAGATASADALPPPPSDAPPADPAATPPPPAAGAAPLAEAPAQPKNDKLGQFLQAQESKRFVGKSITLQLRDADLIDVFRLIGETSGFNIVMGDDVKGRVTLSLVDVPWDQALDMILRTNKLGAERNNNVLRIATLQSLVSEKTQQLQAKIASEASAPRVTRIFPISYANLSDLQKILVNFVSGSSSSAPGAGSGSLGGAVVSADQRTNSIVVRDTVENIEKMKRPYRDARYAEMPQVLIEAKIVEVKKSFSNQIGGLHNGHNSNPVWGATFNSPVSPFDTLGGGSFLSSGGGAFGTSVDLSIIPGFSPPQRTFEHHGESKLETVSFSIVNKQAANVVQAESVVIPVTTSQTNAAR